MKNLLLLLVVAWQFSPSTAATCNNITHLDYFSYFSLGRQDEFNRTFTRIQNRKENITAVTWTINSSVTYTISKIVPTYYYVDSNQRAEFFKQKITIIGGVVDVRLNFEWSRVGGSDNLNGTGIASTTSELIGFELKLIMS
jgi:hypothetical protein